jgi:hypothetical protein
VDSCSRRRISTIEQAMRRKKISVLLAGVALMVSAARGGHELPVYPSFYPHEIEIRTIPAAQAPNALREAKIQAYIGGELNFTDAPAEQVRAIESLGSFVVVRVNPDSVLVGSDSSGCAIAKAAAQELTGQTGFVLHPYPVTPLQGDYLYHFDLATAAKKRFSQIQALPNSSRIKATGNIARDHTAWSHAGPDWDAEVIEVDATRQLETAMFSVNGLIGPPWLRAGWFNAARLREPAVADADLRQRVEAAARRLKAGDFADVAQRINLERELVSALAGDCRHMVVGYTVKREYVNVEFSAGIENIGYDAITGLHSPIFVRTVKLKDFPWNGWLSLGIANASAAAWNPVGGMSDRFGRMLGFALEDSALLPSPYEAGWMLNRISDLPSDARR